MERNIEGLIVDIDGVVINKERVIEGSDVALRRLQDAGKRIVYATNNSRLTQQQHVERFASIGIPAHAEQFVTSSSLTGEYLARIQQETGRKLRAFVIGLHGLYDALEQHGIAIARDGWQKDKWGEGTLPTHVVVGFKPQFSLEQDGYPAVCAMLDPHDPAKLVASNDDATYRSASGTLLPANGFVVAGLQASTGAKATVLGKPHTPMFEEAIRRLRLPADAVAMVGDNLREDLSGVARFNEQFATRLQAFAVLTGVATRETLDASDVRVDQIFPDLRAIADALV